MTLCWCSNRFFPIDFRIDFFSSWFLSSLMDFCSVFASIKFDTIIDWILTSIYLSELGMFYSMTSSINQRFIWLITEKFQKNIKSTNYIPAKSDASVFSIRHYAGKVTYDALLFLEKNRNFLPPEVVELFRMSNNPVVQYLFQCPLTKTGNLFSKVRMSFKISNCVQLESRKYLDLI